MLSEPGHDEVLQELAPDPARAHHKQLCVLQRERIYMTAQNEEE